MAEIFQDIKNHCLLESIIREHKNTGSESYIETTGVTINFLKEYISEDDYLFMRSLLDKKKIENFIQNESVIRAMYKSK